MRVRLEKREACECSRRSGNDGKGRRVGGGEAESDSSSSEIIPIPVRCLPMRNSGD